jgi:geranylgeranyl pyrophosphate synthase
VSRVATTTARPVAAEVVIGLDPALVPQSPLWDSCHYVAANPGKRVRAGILEAAAGYGPHPGDPAVERCAVAIELFHVATLAHDDVVDDGHLRRGKATIGTHAGNVAASLTGGWLFARSAELIAESGAEVAAQFATATSIVCEGEMRESLDLHDVDRSRERYLEVIEAKTARLIAFAGWLGATVGGAGPELAARLEDYGLAVGMAFQIADDVLDLVAEEAEIAKTPGNDLRQGCYSLPTIFALERDPELRTRLVQGPEPTELPELVERIHLAGGIEAALAECDLWIGRAREALPLGVAPPEHERSLLSLAEEVAGRAEAAVRS